MLFSWEKSLENFRIGRTVIFPPRILVIMVSFNTSVYVIIKSGPLQIEYLIICMINISITIFKIINDVSKDILRYPQKYIFKDK